MTSQPSSLDGPGPCVSTTNVSDLNLDPSRQRLGETEEGSYFPFSLEKEMAEIRVNDSKNIISNNNNNIGGKSQR